MTEKDPDKVQIHPSVQKTDISTPQHLKIIDANLAEQFGVKSGTPRERIASLWEAQLAEEHQDYTMLQHRLNYAIQYSLNMNLIAGEFVKHAIDPEATIGELTIRQIEKLRKLLTKTTTEDFIAEMFGFPAEKYDEMKAAIKKGVEWEKEQTDKIVKL